MHEQGPIATPSSGLVTRIGRALLGLGVGLLALVAVAGPADASAVVPVTDYASYPAALPDGCPGGTAALVDVQFENGRGGTASALWGLDVRHGDTVTMSWAGWHASCKSDGDPAVDVSLAAYDTPTTSFDPSVDQRLDTWASCGARAGACDTTGGRHRLVLTLPGDDEICNVQLDAVLGLPLAVVGPSGSFYSSGSRGSGPNMLLSAAHFDLQPCVAATSTSVAPTSTGIAPTSTPEGTGSTTSTTEVGAATTAPSTTAPAPTTSEAPTTSAGPTTTAEAPPSSIDTAGSAVLGTSTTSSVPGVSTAATRPDEVLAAAVAGSSLPRTGSDSFALLRAAALLCLAGGSALATLGLARRRRAGA